LHLLDNARKTRLDDLKGDRIDGHTTAPATNKEPLLTI
jgi:hypothetical protein